jgi:hypothetical protein
MAFFPRMALAILVSSWPAAYAGAQQLDCQPCNDHYGRIVIGNSVQRIMVLKNTGTKSLRIKAKAVTGEAYSFGNFPLPADIGAGQSLKMAVNFAPTVAGKNTGTITLTSNAKNSKFAIDVAGVGVSENQGHLTVSPSSLNFGNVSVGSTASLTVTLSATVAPVKVSSIDSSSAEFSLLGVNLPITVNVGSNVSLTVVFAPLSSGTASATMTLNSNADDSPGTVALGGVGVAVTSHSADLTWDPSNDPVVGYNVYRGNKKGGPYSMVNDALDPSTNFTDSTVQGGTTYYYVVKAVNADDQESGPSNEAKVVIPTS